MALRINQNVAAYNAHRNLTMTDNALSKSLERLSSGLRINRSADDAAGLSISEKLRSQVGGLNQASRNAQDGIALIQTAEGALSESHAMLQRMRTLAVQAANGTLATEDLAAIQLEISQLSSEVDRIATSTEYNGMVLLTGTLGASIGNLGTGLAVDAGISGINTVGAAVGVGYSIEVVANGADWDVTVTAPGGTNQTVTSITAPSGFDTKTVRFGDVGIEIVFNSAMSGIAADNTFDVTAVGLVLQVGANVGQTINVAIDNMRSTALGVDALDVTTTAGANAAITALDLAVAGVSDTRATLGAAQNRLEHTIANLGVAAENLSASESRIRDVDMAAEMVSFTRNQIMVQAGTAMLAQANAVPQTVLQLLR